MKVFVKMMLLAFFTCQLLMAAVKTDTKAPDFSLMGHDGKNHKLSSFRGKTVVLEWYNKDCPYVKKHYSSNNMQSLQKEFTAKNVVWLSIISSAPGKQGYLKTAEVGEVMKTAQSKPSYVLFDPKGTVGKTYAAKTTPHMYVIDSQGTLRYQGAIDSNSSSDSDTIKTAQPWFKEALTAVLTGKAVKQKTTKPYGCSVKYADKTM